MAAYAKACDLTTNDKSSSDSAQEGESTLRKMMWKLNSAYGGKITLTVKSNKIIIGKTATSGIKGGTIQINGQSNIQIRNLTIQDAYDPFPHHEVNSKGSSDGYTAQWDGINVQGTCSHIWIDHCTFEDTLSLAHVYTTGDSETVDEKGNKKYDEKWQTYDGLCDIKGNTQYVTVSYCKFRNHDKTMLIGNDDDESSTLGSGDNFKPRKMTLHHNYFYNCTQRLPMVRNTNIHIFNNYYHAATAPYGQDYAIGIRYQANVYSEKNYFSSGIQYSYSGNDSKHGTLWVVDDEDASSKKGKGTGSYDIATTAPFTPPYDWTADETTNLPTTIPTVAGAGATIGEQSGGSSSDGITNIAFSATVKTIVAGDTLDLTKLVTLTPSTADVSGLTWTVESGTSATVTDGVVTASSTAGDTVVKVASTADTTVSATFTVTVVEASAQVYNFLALTNADYDSSTSAVTSVASTDSTKTLTCTNVVFQDSSYGIKYNSGSIVIPTSGADTTIIAYVTYKSGTSLTLSDGSGYSVERTIQNLGTRNTEETSGKIDFKDNAGPQAYVWRYTGGAASVTLTAVGQVYVGKLFVDNDAITDTQTTSKFDFTVANSDGMNDIPTVSTGSSKKIYFFSSGTQSDINHATLFFTSQYGMKLQALYGVDYVFTASKGSSITVHSSANKGTYYLFAMDGTQLATGTISGGDNTIAYSGTSSEPVILNCTNNWYCDYIEVKAGQ